MARHRVSARPIADAEAVVDVMPMFRRGISGVDAERLDTVDGLQDPLDLWPTGDREQDDATPVAPAARS